MTEPTPPLLLIDDLIKLLALARSIKIPGNGFSVIEDEERRATLVVAAPNDQMVAKFDWDVIGFNPHTLAALFARLSPKVVELMTAELLNYRGPKPPDLDGARKLLEAHGYRVQLHKPWTGSDIRSDFDKAKELIESFGYFVGENVAAAKVEDQTEEQPIKLPEPIGEAVQTVTTSIHGTKYPR